jgi:hypothetical protein
MQQDHRNDNVAQVYERETQTMSREATVEEVDDESNYDGQPGPSTLNKGKGKSVAFEVPDSAPNPPEQVIHRMSEPW